jgi:Tol biopolymer transport system component
MMSDLWTILERGVGGTTPPPDGFERMLRRRDRQRRNQRIAAGVVGIAVFVTAVWIVTSVGSSDRTQTPADPGGAETGPTPTPPAGNDLYTDLIDLNTGEMTALPKSIAGGLSFSVSPDGTKVAYIAGPVRIPGDLFIANLDGTDVQQLTHNGRVGGSSLGWSPDGEAIAFAGVSGEFHNIFVLDLATGETSQVTNEKPPTKTHPSEAVRFGADAPHFSLDGGSIVYEIDRGDGAGLRIVPVTGGKSVLLVGSGKSDINAGTGTFSPDGSTLAMACSGRLEGICIADAQGTNLRVLVSGPSLIGPRWSRDGTWIAYSDQSNGFRVPVVDVATGETTFVAEGVPDDWFDDHTLILEHPFGP